MSRITVLLIGCAILFSACAGTKWVRTSVAKEYEFIVALEQRQDVEATAQQKYQQPYKIALADLKKLMADLTYLEKSAPMTRNEPAQVFQPAEIDRLAPILADTLAKAAANQRIRFLSFNQAQAVVFSDSRKTEGVMFVETGGRLNIAFNYVNSKRLPSESSAIHASYSPVEPLNIAQADTTLIPTAPYVELRRSETGQQAPLWMVADLDKLRAAVVAAPVPAQVVAPPPAAVPQVPNQAAPAPVAVPVPVPVAEPAPAPVPAPAAVDPLRAEVKNKLRYLKELFDEGLISEKDYNTKKMQLLDKID